MSSQLSETNLDAELASKKKKMHPREDDEDLKSSNSKKLKATGSVKSVSKSKMSTQKKCEVTFSEEVEEIKENGITSCNKENEEAESNQITTTPLKMNSPSKHVMKSVREHVKTPFSKIKEGEGDGTPLLEKELVGSSKSRKGSRMGSVIKNPKELKFGAEILQNEDSNGDGDNLQLNEISKLKSIGKSSLKNENCDAGDVKQEGEILQKEPTHGNESNLPVDNSAVNNENTSADVDVVVEPEIKQEAEGTTSNPPETTEISNEAGNAQE
jgi:hypothetical protein